MTDDYPFIRAGRRMLKEKNRGLVGRSSPQKDLREGTDQRRQMVRACRHPAREGYS